MRRTVVLLVFVAVLVCGAVAGQAIHVVKPGDTVYSIARAYNVPPDAVLAANGIRDAKNIRPGQKLVIPSVHRVQKGETIYGIARQYGVTADAILKANGMKAGDTLKAGALIYIPGGEAPKTASNPANGSDPATKPAGTPPGHVDAPATPTKADVPGPWPAAGSLSYLEGKLFGVMIEAALGSPIRSVRTGSVVSAGPFRGYGLVCFVQSSDGLVYVYGGASRLDVKAGDKLAPGAQVGVVGADMETGKPIAYFFVFRNGKATDPASAPREIR